MQHDYQVDNDTGAKVRQDINAALQAIVTNNSGATAPTVTFPYQIWVDTSASPSVLKIRDGANATWLVLGSATTNFGLVSAAGATMTGVLKLLAGTAALPGASIAGDPDTGIFSPGANQLSLSAGGTEMLRADFATFIQLLGTAGVQFPVGTTAQRPTGAAGLVRYNSELGKFEAFISNGWMDLHGNQPTANFVTLNDQTTPGVPNPNTRKLYSKSDGKLYTLNSSGIETPIGSGGGSGSGSKNYFALSNANPDFEGNTYAPWLTVATTFTNGVPGNLLLNNGQMAIGINAPGLSGSYDLAITKPGSNVQGSGFASGVLTFEREDSAKMINGSFSYACSNTNFDASGGSTQSMEIWIYDVTASAAAGYGVWIQPTGYRGMNQNKGAAKCTFSFQTPAYNLSNQFRVCIFTNQPASAGYAVEFDNFVLGPQAILTGAVVTDWQSYTPTGSWTNTTYSGRFRRVGDELEMQVGISLTGTPSGGNLTVNLPSGLSIDSTKFALSNAGNYPVVGQGGALNPGVASYIFEASYLTATSLLIAYQSSNSATAAAVSPTTPISWVNGQSLYVRATVPIQGWSSNTQMSSDTDTRVVTYAAAPLTFSAVNGTSNGAISGFTANVDTHGAGTTTGLTIPVSGYYQLFVSVGTNAAVGPGKYVGFRIDGSPVGNLAGGGGTSYGQLTNLLPIFLKAGQTVGLVYTATSGTTENWTIGQFTATRLSGPSAVAATESVNCAYNSNGAQANIANGGNTTVTVYTNKEYDSHGAWNGNTFTAPVPGVYQATACFQFVASGSGIRVLYAVGNGILKALQYNVGSTSNPTLSGTAKFKLLAGQTITFQAYQNNGGLLSNTTDPVGNYMSIEKVGN